jgi:BirA family biotin operon repressor/biotin-[acetyl-CoA-carboxylase] ligase
MSTGQNPKLALERSEGSKIQNPKFGRLCEYYPRIGSTMDRARELALAGAAEGALVLADEQVRGRGQRGREWVAPPGSAILASLLLRPHCPAEEMFAPTMILGCAIRAAVRAWGAPAVLKWPNDVLCRGRKLAGILCEMSLGAAGPDFLIAGFGVNIDLDPAVLRLETEATSLRWEITGPLPDRAVLLDQILVEAEMRYERWQAGNYMAIWEEWRAVLATLGRRVRIDLGAGALLEGEAVRVERAGGLIVVTAD